jgi:hypothetical protein
MELSKKSRIALGIATLLEVVIPLSIVLLYMLVFFLLPVIMAVNPGRESVIVLPFMVGMILLFLLLIFFSIFQLAMKVLYILFVIRNKQASDLARVLFILGTFYLPYIAMPVYYVTYFLKEDVVTENQS